MELYLAEDAKMQVRSPFPSRRIKYKSETNGRWIVDCCPRFVLRNSATAKPISQTTMTKIEKLKGKVRIYLTGERSHCLEPAVGLNMLDSRNQVVTKVIDLLGTNRIDIMVKVKYLQRELTTEGFRMHGGISSGKALRGWGCSSTKKLNKLVFKGRSFPSAVKYRCIDPNKFTITISMMLPNL